MLSKIRLMVMLLGVMVFTLLLAKVTMAEEAKKVEEAKEEKAEKVKEEELAFGLGKVVVTGTKTEKRLADVPVRTEIITAADIKAKGAVTLYEALEGMPGIRIEQQCSYCNFSIVRMQGLESGHLQVLIDGQPIFSGLAGVYGLQQVPTANIERIEVVKGAGSALYGSSAIAGAINIITKKPS